LKPKNSLFEKNGDEVQCKIPQGKEIATRLDKQNRKDTKGKRYTKDDVGFYTFLFDT